MKLLYCIPSLDSAGGTERVLTNKLNYLTEHCPDWNIIVVLTESQKTVPFFPLNETIKIYKLDIDYRAESNFFLRGLKFFFKRQKHKRELKRILLMERPDITTSLLSYEVEFMSSFKDGSIKIGENHFNKNFRLSFAKSQKSCIKTILAKWRNRNLINNVNKLDCLVTLTQSDYDAWFEIPKSQKRIIPNALTSFSEKVSNCVNKRVIAVGRYTPQKGYDMLLSAWKIVQEKNPGWELYIFGDGEERKRLESIRDNLKLKTVHLEHTVSNVNAEFVEASFSVLSSRFEGFGLVIIEAMSAGLPVIAFNCEYGPSEIISNGIDGFLVKNGNVEMLADKINYLIDNENERIKMGSIARIKSQRYKRDNIMSQWITLYNDLKK